MLMPTHFLSLAPAFTPSMAVLARGINGRAAAAARLALMRQA
jgi:hypothetical protein